MGLSLFGIKIDLHLDVVILESGVESLIFGHNGLVLEVLLEVLNKLLPHAIFDLAEGALFFFCILNQ